MLVTLKKYFMKKNVKIKLGYINACIYNFNDKNAYVITKENAQDLLEGNYKNINPKLIEVLLRNNVITLNHEESEGLFFARGNSSLLQIFFLTP